MKRSQRKRPGSFKDFGGMFDQLGKHPVIEIANPVPEDKYLLLPKVGRCPAAHNRALLDSPI